MQSEGSGGLHLSGAQAQERSGLIRSHGRSRYLIVFLTMYVSMCLSIYLSIYLFICMSVHSCINLSTDMLHMY